MGIIMLVLAVFLPYIERKVDHLPGRMTGAIGAGLIMLVFVLQSVRYWGTFLSSRDAAESSI